MLVLVLLVACGKDKFETKPRIEIKSYNDKTIARNNGNELRITLNYYDKEGDLSEGDFFAVRNHLNVKPLNPSTEDKSDTLRYQLPKFPDIDHGEIVFQIGYDFLKESLSENDTITFRFAVADRGSHKSDTITSAKLVILK
jgi:hypothetical protein